MDSRDVGKISYDGRGMQRFTLIAHMQIFGFGTQRYNINFVRIHVELYPARLCNPHRLHHILARTLPSQERHRVDGKRFHTYVLPFAVSKILNTAGTELGGKLPYSVTTILMYDRSVRSNSGLT